MQPGEILVSWSASLGVFTWTGPDVALLNQHIFRVVPDAQKIDPRYLRFGLELALLDMQKHLHGATMRHVNRGEFLGTRIYVPRLHEQRRIAGVLDQADALRAKRRAALAKLDGLNQAMLRAVSAGCESENGIPVAKLSDLCSRITDGTHQPPEWAQGGIPFLFVSNIVDGEINFSTAKFISAKTHSELMRRCPIEIGDVLYSTVGSYGNAAAVMGNRKFAFQRHIAHLKPDAAKVRPEVLAVALKSAGVRKQADQAARGVAQKTINLSDLQQFTIPLPPISIQSELVRQFSRVRKIKDRHLAALPILDALFSSLQQRAFRGEL